MRQLPAFNDEPAERLSRIVAAKRPPTCDILAPLLGQVTSRYEEYRRCVPNLHDLAPTTFDDDARDALIHCYQAKTKPVDELLQSILGNLSPADKNICRYCGLDAPHTMDHYLPISRFPEFGVLSINLIPCCFRCNLSKGAIWELGTRTVLNLYFDNVANYRLLDCRIAREDNVLVARYSLRRAQFVSDDSWHLVQAHCRHFDLLRQYGQRGTLELSELNRQFDAGDGRESVIGLVKRMWMYYSDLTRTHGSNYWRTALYRAVTKFCASLPRS